MFIIDLKKYHMITIIGILICVCGEITRKLAIITASTNFNHLVCMLRWSEKWSIAIYYDRFSFKSKKAIRLLHMVFTDICDIRHMLDGFGGALEHRYCPLVRAAKLICIFLISSYTYPLHGSWERSKRSVCMNSLRRCERSIFTSYNKLFR